MIKPFEIMSTQAEAEGTGVLYRVKKRVINGNGQSTFTIEGYLLVPRGQDIDAATYQYLKSQGLAE